MLYAYTPPIPSRGWRHVKNENKIIRTIFFSTTRYRVLCFYVIFTKTNRAIPEDTIYRVTVLRNLRKFRIHAWRGKIKIENSPNPLSNDVDVLARNHVYYECGALAQCIQVNLKKKKKKNDISRPSKLGIRRPLVNICVG